MALPAIPASLQDAIKPQTDQFKKQSNPAGILITTMTDGSERIERTHNPYYTHTLSISLILSASELKDFMDWGENVLERWSKPFLWEYSQTTSLRYDEARFIIEGANSIQIVPYRFNGLWKVSFRINIRETDTQRRIPDAYADIIDGFGYDNLLALLQALQRANPKLATMQASVASINDMPAPPV